MGSVDKRLRALERSWNELARDEQEEGDLRIRRFLARSIVAEHARLRERAERAGTS
jgi:hypothetical protein